MARTGIAKMRRRLRDRRCRAGGCSPCTSCNPAEFGEEPVDGDEAALLERGDPLDSVNREIGPGCWRRSVWAGRGSAGVHLTASPATAVIAVDRSGQASVWWNRAGSG